MTLSDANPSYSDLLALRQEEEDLRRQIELKRKCGIAFYKPHVKQDKFHRAGRIKRRFCRTGNRWGKSTAGICETIAWLLGYRPWYPETDPARYEGIPARANKGILIVCDWDKSEEIFTSRVSGKLFQFLPTDSIIAVKNGQNGRCDQVHVKSIHGGTSVLYLDTIDSWRRNKLSQESSDWDFAHIDEPIPEGMWKAIARGFVDRDGSAWFMCTPLTEMWINDMFWPDGNVRDPAEDGCIASTTIEGYKLEVWKITGSMHDNLAFSGEAKARFIGTLRPEERETRIAGRPTSLTGIVYSEFDPDRHVLSSPPRGWSAFNRPLSVDTIRLAIDTHPVKPTAVLFIATRPSGHAIIYDEIYEKALIPEICKLIRFKLQGREPLRCLLELAAYTENPIDGFTIADAFAHEGFPIEPAPRDLAYGILETKAQLLDTDERGHPLLLFSPLLPETLREIDRYVWNGDTGKPVDAHDHMMENLYRLVISDLSYVAPEDYNTPHVRYTNPSRMDLSLPEIPMVEMPGQDKKKKDYKRSKYRTAPNRDMMSQCIDSPEYRSLMRGVRV